MNIKPITIPLTTEKYLTFGMLTKPPTKIFYAPDCWNEISEGKFKDYSFTIFNNYKFSKRESTAIFVKKLNKWVKSKLKYINNKGENKTLWSHADDSILRQR